MVLGKVERSNSWDVFFAPNELLQSVITLVTTPEHVLISLLLGIFSTSFYFLFRLPVHKRIHLS